eukprot:313230_1
MALFSLLLLILCFLNGCLSTDDECGLFRRFEEKCMIWKRKYCDEYDYEYYNEYKCGLRNYCCKPPPPPPEAGTCINRKKRRPRKLLGLIEDGVCEHFNRPCDVDLGGSWRRRLNGEEPALCTCATTVNGDPVCSNVPQDFDNFARLCGFMACSDDEECIGIPGCDGPLGCACIDVEPECVDCMGGSDRRRMSDAPMPMPMMPGRCLPLCTGN